MEKRRLEFKCWQCQKTYTLLRDVGEGNPVLNVACPFCGTGATVDLDPYRQKIDKVYRGDENRQVISAGDWVYDLPDILPTQPRE